MIRVFYGFLLDLQGIFPVFTISIFPGLQGRNLHGWRRQGEAWPMSWMKCWKSSALCFPGNNFILKGSNRAKFSLQPLEICFARREQNSGQNQKGSTGTLWETWMSPSVLAELGSLYMQVNSLPCNGVIHEQTSYIFLPTISTEKFSLQWEGPKETSGQLKYPWNDG